MDMVDYIKEVNRQLEDKNTYQKLEKSPTDTFNTDVQNYLENMVKNGDITDNVRKLLVVNKPRTPHIHFLPKIQNRKTLRQADQSYQRTTAPRRKSQRS